MTTVAQTPNNNTDIPVKNQLVPKEGPKVIPYAFNLATAQSYEVNLQNLIQLGKISFIQTVWVDNRENDNAIVFINSPANYTLSVPAKSQGFFPMVASNPMVLIVESPMASIIVPVNFMNVPIAPMLWSGAANASDMPTMPVSDAILESTVSGGKILIKDASSYTPLGYEQLATLTTAQSLTVPGGATFAYIGAEGDDLRWRDDGTSPNATTGMILPENTYFWYDGDLAAIEFIEITGSGVLNVSYYSA